LKAKSANTNLTFPVTYYFEKEERKKVVLLLHGYRMHARKALMDFEQMIPDDYSILAPNGFFPIPKSDKSISRMGYSWYFEDHKSGKSIFSVEQSKNALLTFIKSLGLKTDLTIVGFSQGAIIGLSLASELENISNLVLISSSPIASNYTGNQNLNILAFHGLEDEVIDYDHAKEGYQGLIEQGHRVHLESFKKTGHNISKESEKLKEMIHSFLKESI
jgi:predicted esterase